MGRVKLSQGGGDTVLNRRTFNNYYVYQTSLFIAELSTLVSWMKYCLKTWTIMGTVRKTTMKNELYLPVTGNRLCENSFQKLLTMTARKSKFLYRSIITSLVKASYLQGLPYVGKRCILLIVSQLIDGGNFFVQMKDTLQSFKMTPTLLWYHELRNIGVRWHIDIIQQIADALEKVCN